ncbi:hypothetical protein K505DRAFT_206019, partial [Melanomma pulvis-pyrius CBS 109.77]
MSTNPAPSKSPQIPHITHSPRSPPLTHFDDPPVPQDEGPEPTYPDGGPFEEDEIPYPEPGSEQTLLPPPNFNPFFTLIEDTTTGEHYHPYVHYVFADDDPVIVTAAAMRSLGLDETRYLPASTPDGAHDKPLHSSYGQEQDQEREDGGEGEELVNSPLPPPIPGAKDRYLLIDVGGDGHTILDAQSLSSEWQIINTQVRPAPSFDEDAGNLGHMLRIEGVEIPNRNKGKTKGQLGEQKLKEARERGDGDVFAALDELVKGVEGGLEVAGKMA